MYDYGKLNHICSFVIDLLEELHIKKICEHKKEMRITVNEVFTKDIYEIIKISGLDERTVLNECKSTFVQPIYNYFHMEINMDSQSNLHFGRFPKSDVLECLLHMLCPKNYKDWKQYGIRPCTYFHGSDMHRFQKAILQYCAKQNILDEKTIRKYYVDTELFMDDNFTHYLITKKPWLK